MLKRGLKFGNRVLGESFHHYSYLAVLSILAESQSNVTMMLQLHLTVSEIQLGQNFKGQGHYNQVQVKSRSHHDAAWLYILTNNLAKSQFPTAYSF